MQGILAVFTTLIVAVLARLTEHYLAKKKSWFPGLLLPLVFAIVLTLGLRYGYPPWEIPTPFPPSDYDAHKAYLADQWIRVFLLVMNLMILFNVLFIYLHARIKSSK